MALIFWLISITILVYFILIWQQKIYKKLPPGPPSIPILGSIPFMKRNVLREKGPVEFILDTTFEKLYSDMYTIWIGYRPLVVIQNYSLAKELFSREEYCGRTLDYFEKYIRGDHGQTLGIIKTMGPLWQEQRRFAVKHLKNLGFGKQKIDTIIQEEARYLIDDFILKSLQGDVLFDKDFNFPIINILWQLVASRKFEVDHPDSKSMMSKVMEMFHDGFRSPFSFLWVVNKLRNLIGKPIFRSDLMTIDLKKMFRRQILENSLEYNSADAMEPRNFIEIYLKEINDRKNTKSQNKQDENYSTFNIEQLSVMCLDFFMAGSETSSTTLLWSVMYLCLNTDVQEKCWKEIEQTLGDKLPSKDDISKLTYCVATIQEVQRISRVAPTTIVHTTLKDVEVNDYMIPKDTMIIANLSKFMMDPAVFDEPEKFKPERFINVDGNTLSIKKINQWVPFGLGKRVCAGESLAVHEVFIFFVMMIQRLKFNPPINHHIPNEKNYFAGFTRIPKSFYVSVVAR